MKFSAISVATVCASFLTLGSFTTTTTTAFSPATTINNNHNQAAFLPNKFLQQQQRQQQNLFFKSSLSSLKMSAATNTNNKYTIGIVGATGAVGKEIRQVLERKMGTTNINSLRIFGSERSVGKVISSNIYGDIPVELFSVNAARECDIVFLAVSGDFALQYAKELIAEPNGCIVIDNSSAFRYESDVPLVVPEINGEETKKSKLIANPNCTTAIGLMALYPLHKAFTLKKVIMSTYQAASGAGQDGMDELMVGTTAYLQKDDTVKNTVFAHPLPFNVIPHIDKFQENGYTKEEMKVAWETRKICNLPDDFPVSCTAVRIPTIRAHSESIIIETEKPVDLAVARQVLEDAEGVSLKDDITKNIYPMPSSCTGQDDIEVGRIRKSLIYGDYGLEFFVCGDQLLRGAALNAVLIAETMIQNGSVVAKTTTESVVAK